MVGQLKRNKSLNSSSSLYSALPTHPSGISLLAFSLSLKTLMNYGMRIHRRLINQELNVVASRKFHAAEVKAAHSFLRKLLESPEDFLGHLSEMAGEVMVSAAYGIDALGDQGRYIALGREATKSFSEASIPGRFLVEFIPILKYVPEWFPGAQFQRIAKEGRKLSESLRNIPFAETKRKMASGNIRPCFTSEALRVLESGNSFYNETTVKNVAGMMYLGGADTTVSVVATFMLAMLANPGAQKKAQQEVDTIVRRSGLPDFGDEKSLPYVAALIKEVLRWRNAGPFGSPHVLTVDDEYKGYHIPAGSIVFGNVWAILHNESEYPDPYSFKPERFLMDGKINPDVRSPDCAFGFGRRICPGRHMALSSVWITIVSLLATFNITKEIDEDGDTIEPSYKFENGVVSSPAPFKCTITPRSEAATRLVHATALEI
ncbi:cytochrome P450 [Favolaschia claudopus]|uniref:Cytochrome P450 n=1 Tax=Favolaschia claudopus TaxID=2862362 RepID=A0AAV9ZR01_9AGAR